jgi:hypothetical protein
MMVPMSLDGKKEWDGTSMKRTSVVAGFVQAIK